jgi:hypothetical protein
VEGSRFDLHLFCSVLRSFDSLLLIWSLLEGVASRTFTSTSRQVVLFVFDKGAGALKPGGGGKEVVEHGRWLSHSTAKKPTALAMHVLEQTQSPLQMRLLGSNSCRPM